MIPVYYFEKMPEQLPDDDACFIVSKYIYLKKRSGLIDSMVQVDSIEMGSVLPEYAHMNLPKIKDKIFGQVQGFFRMVYGKYRSEAGVILNLKTHPQKSSLKKIDYTVPHQRVSGGACKYQIVIDPTYVNCGTIHSHSNFGAFHSGTDVNDERYFDGLHITVGHNAEEKISISACIVINGKRIKVDPLQYIEGLKKVDEKGDNDFYEFLDKSLVVENQRYLDYVTPIVYQYNRPSGYRAPGTINTGTGEQTKFNWDAWYKTSPPLEPTVPCQECIYKEVKIDNLLDDIDFEDDDQDLLLDAMEDDEFRELDKDLFDEDDKHLMENTNLFGFERDSAPLYQEGEIDEDGIKREDRRVTMDDYLIVKRRKLSRSIKCDCETTFFVDDPEVLNKCPSCEKEHPAQRFTFQDFINFLHPQEQRPEK